MKPARQVLLAAGVCFVGYSSLLPESRAQTVTAQDIARCAAFTADMQRLACYDRLAQSTATQRQAPPASPPSEQTEQSFGIVKPTTVKPQGPSHINAKVQVITADSRGGAVVQLDNGQTWLLDDSAAMLNAGDSIVIKRAALGSFLMTTPTSRIYRVQRLR